MSDEKRGALKIRNGLKRRRMQYSRLEAAALILSMATALFIVLFINYGDTDALLRTHSFWDSLSEGSVLHFYDNHAAVNIHNCNFISRLPLLIWYLPSWALTRLSGSKIYTTFYHQMWHKLFLGIIYLLCIRLMLKIGRYIGRDDDTEKYTLLLMGVSPGIILSVFYAGQDEIIYITCFMYALLHYIKGNRRQYYFWMVWSIICSPIMFLPCLVLVLMDDKEWYSIMGKMMVPLIPSWLYNIFFSGCLTIQLPINPAPPVTIIIYMLSVFSYAPLRLYFSCLFRHRHPVFPQQLLYLFPHSYIFILRL